MGDNFNCIRDNNSFKCNRCNKYQHIFQRLVDFNYNNSKFVPKDANIKVKSTPIFGGVSNKIKNDYDEKLPTIYINSFCMFGGVEIK